MPILTNSILQRITLVMASTTLGGLEKHVTELALGLSSRGYQVTVIADGRYRDDFTNSKVNFVALDFSRSRRNPILLWQLYQAIVRSNPDIVHVHASKAAQLVSSLQRYLPRAPHYMVTLHAVKSKQAYLAFYQTIIAVSEPVLYTIPPALQSRGVVILNGMHPPPMPHQYSKQVDCIAIGALRPIKGFDILIQAMPSDASLWIVGEGEERTTLQQQINSSSKPERIQLLGYRDDVAKLLPQAKLYVLSSRAEGGPLTLVESLLLQVPVIATKVGIAPQVLPEQYLVDAGDATQLGEKIAWALANYEQVQADFAPIFDWAKQELTFDKMLDNIVAIYEQVDKKDR